MPTKTIALTFDDAVSNHATLCGPLLKKHGFRATFYVCEFPPDFATNKQQYMTWPQIKMLHDDGFEIGNHTLRHRNVIGISAQELETELTELEERCQQHGIAKPITFAYPGGPGNENAFPVLLRKGYNLARSVDARCYVPGKDNPLLVPSFPVHGEDKSLFYNAVAQAAEGRIPVLMFHGVPEYTHPWVNTRPELFMEYIDFLAKNNFTVIALRELL
jgi:peptidoglycan-N-acetylglucosamine deacetylase